MRKNEKIWSDLKRKWTMVFVVQWLASALSNQKALRFGTGSSPLACEMTNTELISGNLSESRDEYIV